MMALVRSIRAKDVLKKFVAVLLVVSLLLLGRSMTTTTKRLKIDERRVPALIKFHKTGGTSVAATLSRAMFCGDKSFRKYRTQMEPIFSSFCGNYDGHWGTIVYRYFGLRGISLCLGSNIKPLAAALFRNPVPRFISRLYYELGGKPELLLASPFAKDPELWTVADIQAMEQITCHACTKINNGHCSWSGGLCDNPQEYLVVLGRGTSLKLALKSLENDFQVIGILEDLHTFFTMLAKALDWPLDALLYASRKVHTSQKVHNMPCTLRRGKRRLTNARQKERLRKKQTTANARNKAINISWSGNFPLLGWNKPNKGPLSHDVITYLESRNIHDMRIYHYAREFQQKYQNIKHVLTFDALQAAYAAGLLPNAQGYYHFCDWRPPYNAQSNVHCRQCIQTLLTRPCRIFLMQKEDKLTQKNKSLLLERPRCRVSSSISESITLQPVITSKNSSQQYFFHLEYV